MRVGDKVLPAGLQKPAAFRFVQLREIRIQPGFDRPFPQDARAERVDGADESVPDIRDGLAHPFADARIGIVGRPLLQALLQPFPQFGRRLPGECHGGDPADLGFPERQDRTDAVHQFGGLAGTRPGFDQKRGIEVLDDAPTCRFVRGGLLSPAHISSPSRQPIHPPQR